MAAGSDPTVNADASTTVSAPIPVTRGLLAMVPMSLVVLVSDLLPAPTNTR